MGGGRKQGADGAAKTNKARAVFCYQRLTWVRKLCRAGMPPSSGVQCIDLRGVFEVAPAQDCSITHREAPAAAPGVLTDYVVEFVNDVRRA